MAFCSRPRQDRKLEVRAAACTAAMHACCKQDLDEVEPARAVMDLFQQMLSWSVRPYDGTLAAVVKSESKLGTWPQALWRLELIRGRGISKLVRSYTAAAEACEASEACDWERSMQLVEISQERSRREADKFLVTLLYNMDRFLQIEGIFYTIINIIQYIYIDK